MEKLTLEQRIFELMMADESIKSRPLESHYVVTRQGRKVTVPEEQLTQQDREQIGELLLQALASQILLIVDLWRHKKSFDRVTKTNRLTEEKPVMHPNVRLRAGFLYWLDTECLVGVGHECTSNGLLAEFCDCVTRSGIFTATVPLDLFEAMLEYKGFVKIGDTWEGLDVRDPLGNWKEFPKFWK